MQLLDDLREKAGYCKLREAALYRTMERKCFGRECGPDVRQATELMT